jgi:hypothetical protein
MGYYEAKLIELKYKTFCLIIVSLLLYGMYSYIEAKGAKGMLILEKNRYGGYKTSGHSKIEEYTEFKYEIKVLNKADRKATIGISKEEYDRLNEGDYYFRPKTESIF